MFINKVISFEGGWRTLSENKPKQMQEILDSLHYISPEIIKTEIDKKIRKEVQTEIKKSLRPGKFLMVSNDEAITELMPMEVVRKKYARLGIDLDTDTGINIKRDMRKLLFSHTHRLSINKFITRNWNNSISSNGWPSSRTKATTSNLTPLFLKHVKEKTSVKLITAHNDMLAKWVYIETQKAHEASVCDLSILLVPMYSYIENYMGGQHSNISFEDLKIQFDDLCPIRTSAPFIIIGFSDIKSDIEVFNTSIIDDDKNNKINTIDKCIEFSPEHYQAGMGILSYFSEIIKTKHPDIQAKVRIEQDGNFVRLHIETEDGTKEIIEKTLENYTLVVSDKAPIESLLDDKIEIMALKNKLEIASMEVRQTRDIHALSRDNSDSRILSLEDEVRHLRSHIGNQLSLVTQSSKIIEAQNITTNKMAMEFIETSKYLIKDIISNNSTNSEIREALCLIEDKLENGVTEYDEAEVKTAIETINEKSPSILEDLETAIKNTAYGVSGNIVYKWLITISNSVF